MMNFKAIALATALTLSFGGVAFAESAIGSLTSASSLSFQTVSPSEEVNVMAGVGPASEQVDLDSLKARLLSNPSFVAQLESYGSSIDDVVGINATDSTDVTILVRG